MEGPVNELVQGLAVALAQLVLLAIERLPIRGYAPTPDNIQKIIKLFVNFENVRFWGLDENHPLYSRLLSRLISSLIDLHVSWPWILDPDIVMHSDAAKLRFVLLAYSLKRKYRSFLSSRDEGDPAVFTEHSRWLSAFKRAALLAAELNLRPEDYESTEPLQLYEQLEFNLRHGGVCGVPRSPGAVAQQLVTFLVNRRFGQVSREHQTRAKEMGDALNRSFYLLDLEQPQDYFSLLKPLRDNLKAFVDSFEQFVVSIRPVTSAVRPTWQRLSDDHLLTPSSTVRRSWQRRTDDGFVISTSTATKLWETRNLEGALHVLARLLKDYTDLVVELLLADSPPEFSYSNRPEVAPAERTFFVDEFSIVDGRLRRCALQLSSELAAVLRSPNPDGRLAFTLREDYGQQ